MIFYSMIHKFNFFTGILMNISSTSLFAVLCLVSICLNCNKAQRSQAAVFSASPRTLLGVVGRDRIAFEKWRRFQLAEKGKRLLSAIDSESVEDQIARQLKGFVRDRRNILNVIDHKGWTLSAVDELFALNQELWDVDRRIQKLRYSCMNGISIKIRGCAARAEWRKAMSTTLISRHLCRKFVKARESGLLPADK
jgi:hypothetical protein